MPRFLLWAVLVVPTFAQSIVDIQRIRAPHLVELSRDGSRLWYKFGENWFEVSADGKSRPTPVSHLPASATKPLEVKGSKRLSTIRTSPDGKRIGYLDAEVPWGSSMLYCLCGDTAPKLISRLPMNDFQWASDSNSFWVVATHVSDDTVGRLTMDGHFEAISQGPAMRRTLAVADDIVAWIENSPAHYGTVWIRDRAGSVRELVTADPQIAKLNWGTQEVVHWKNSHGEELEGMLALPPSAKEGPVPLVDPYSSWRNRFLNVAATGNVGFTRSGYAVFFPNHRAPHGYPERSFGSEYIGASKDRDPMDVLMDDVMSGVNTLIRRRVVDPDHMFLYSMSTGASSIDQMLTQTKVFRAAVAHAGVADWLGYYPIESAARR